MRHVCSVGCGLDCPAVCRVCVLDRGRHGGARTDQDSSAGRGDLACRRAYVGRLQTGEQTHGHKPFWKTKLSRLTTYFNYYYINRGASRRRRFEHLAEGSS